MDEDDREKLELIPINHREEYAANATLVNLDIEGMTCTACVSSVERALQDLQGVTDVQVLLLAQKATISFDSNLITPFEICETVNDIGFDAKIEKPPNKKGTTELQIFGMSCSSCVNTIETQLGRTAGIYSCEVSLSTEISKIEYDYEKIGIRGIIAIIEDLGFDAIVHQRKFNVQLESLQRAEEILHYRRNFIRSLYLSIPIMLLSKVFSRIEITSKFLEHSFILPGLTIDAILQLALVIPIQFGIGKEFYIHSYKALKNFYANMDCLISLGTSIAFFFSVISIFYSILNPHHPKPKLFFETSAMLITFISLGKYLENKAKRNTCAALSKLLSLAPAKATLLERDLNYSTVKEVEISTELIQINDLLKIYSGERIPVDGVIIDGKSDIDESMVTGEPNLVTKSSGDQVIGGTVNGSNTFTMKATHIGEETLLSRIVQLIEDAQLHKPPIQTLADKVSSIFVPVVILLGLATFIGWTIYCSYSSHLPTMFYSDGNHLVTCIKIGITVIVVACPCALGLSTPTAVMVGTGVAAQNGILIRGGEALETMTKITKVVFDKTGTLTTGHLAVTDHLLLDSSFEHTLILSLVGLVESNSEHPIGKSLLRFVKEKVQSDKLNAQVVSYESIPGQGVSGTVEDSTTKTRYQIRIGNPSLVENATTSISESLYRMKERHERTGKTVVFVKINHEICGLFVLQDEIRPELPLVISHLKKSNFSLAMITGDQSLTANYLGKQCNIFEIHSGVTPQGKIELIKQFQSLGHKVCMIGDGINDSPALIQADVGVTLSSGTDIAMESSNIILMRNSMTDFLVALDLCNRIQSKIRFNFMWATLYNIISIPIAMGLLLPWGIMMNPIFASLIMALSSVSVVTSSLLLKLYKIPSEFASENPNSGDFKAELFDQLRTKFKIPGFFVKFNRFQNYHILQASEHEMV